MTNHNIFSEIPGVQKFIFTEQERMKPVPRVNRKKAEQREMGQEEEITKHEEIESPKDAVQYFHTFHATMDMKPSQNGDTHNVDNDNQDIKTVEETKETPWKAPSDQPPQTTQPNIPPNLDKKFVKLSKRQVWLCIIGLALALFLAALDNTILSTALPTISRELNATTAEVKQKKVDCETSKHFVPNFRLSKRCTKSLQFFFF